MNRLKELRTEKGLYQKDLAKTFNVAVSTYSYWEQGKFEPDGDTLGKIADYFGVTVDYLLGREAGPERDEKPQLHIPDKYKDVLVAFEGGADDLTQEDVDKVIEYIELLRTKNRSKK